MPHNGSTAFRVVIVILGLLNILIGINVGFGGILTLGLQGQITFFEIVNEQAYLVQDSHIRFFGGLFGGIGLFLILASTHLRKYGMGLYLIFAVIFLGGLARFTMMRSDIVFGKEIIGSLFVELFVMPVLFFWLLKIVPEQEKLPAIKPQTV